MRCVSLQYNKYAFLTFLRTLKTDIEQIPPVQYTDTGLLKKTIFVRFANIYRFASIETLKKGKILPFARPYLSII